MTGKGLRRKIARWLRERGEEVLMADGLDEALIGIGTSQDGETVAIYSESRAIEVLARTMDPAEAKEYFTYNVAQGCGGRMAPIFIDEVPFLCRIEWHKT